MLAAVRPATAVMARYVPIVRWLPRYERRWLRFDVLAGVAVWAVLMPQAIAYASLAGAPPAAGFYAAAAAVLAYALLGTCKELSVGPSTTPAIAAASLVAAASVAPDQVPALLAALALSSGIIMVAAGLLRLGFVADFLSRPVLVGFVTGIAIDVIVGQLPKLFGVPAGSGNSFQKAWTLLRHVPDTHGRTLIVGVAGLAAVVVLQRLAPLLPAALIVVTGSIAASRLLDLSAKGVAVVSDLPSTLPSVSLPHVGFDNFALVLGGGLALALISFAESIGAARSIARRHRYEVDPNQELIGLGGGNVLGGFLQGFPTDASLSRSAVADAARVRSSLYGLAVLVLLIVTIVWLTPLFDGLPQATLAAVIIGSIYRLIDVAGLRHLYRIDPKGDFPLALIALLGVLIFGALGGIATAVVASLIVLIAKLYRPTVTVLGRSRDGEADEDIRFRSVERHPDCETFPGLVIVRFGGELFFANASFLRTTLRGLVANADPPVEEVILDASAIPRIDTTAGDVLHDLLAELGAEGITLVVARTTHGLREDLQRFALVGTNSERTAVLADSVGHAVAQFHAVTEVLADPDTLT
jgi:SulP family sulfate permease